MWHALFLSPSAPNASLVIGALDRASDQISCCKIPDLATAKNALLKGDPSRHILIVDGAAAQPEARETLSKVRTLGQCRIVRAYSELDEARQTVAHGMYPAVLDGFFPWAADLWQQYQILRCLQIGLHPLPHDLDWSALHEPSVHGRSETTGRASLTSREREVLRHMETGTLDASIAKKLGVSEDAVKLHVHQIFNKLGFTNAISCSLIEARFRG